MEQGNILCIINSINTIMSAIFIREKKHVAHKTQNLITAQIKFVGILYLHNTNNYDNLHF